MEGFHERGFLTSDVDKLVYRIRHACAASFEMAAEVNTTLMRTIDAAVASPWTEGHNWTKEAVAIRLLMRSTSMFQGVVSLIERGMAVEARTLVRAIVEDSFFSAALTTEPDKVIQMLRDGEEAARRVQGQFIVGEKLGDGAFDLKKLEAAIDSIDRTLGMARPRKVANMSSMKAQYLTYMRLSNDSAHTSAASLNKHINVAPDRSGWNYVFAPALQQDVESTLAHASRSVIPAAIVVTQLLDDTNSNRALQRLAERTLTVPQGGVI